MRLVLAAALAVAAALSLPASAEDTCLYVQKPGAPRHVACTSGGTGGCTVSIGFTAECSGGSCTVNAGTCGPGADCTVNAGTCLSVTVAEGR